MNVVVQILLVLLKAFLPAILQSMQPTAEQAAGPGELEERLKKKLKAEGWK